MVWFIGWYAKSALRAWHANKVSLVMDWYRLSNYRYVQIRSVQTHSTIRAAQLTTLTAALDPNLKVLFVII